MALEQSSLLFGAPAQVTTNILLPSTPADRPIDNDQLKATQGIPSPSASNCHPTTCSHTCLDITFHCHRRYLAQESSLTATIGGDFDTCEAIITIALSAPPCLLFDGQFLAFDLNLQRGRHVHGRIMHLLNLRAKIVDKITKTGGKPYTLIPFGPVHESMAYYSIVEKGCLFIKPNPTAMCLRPSGPHRRHFHSWLSQFSPYAVSEANQLLDGLCVWLFVSWHI